MCGRLGRSPEEITLIGVTKYAPVKAINEAIAAGIFHVGENKVQEALKKYPEIISPALSPASPVGGGITKHMIGHLQTNKVKAALEIFDVIQSVDSLKLATAIEKEAAKLYRPVNILLEVNTSGEVQKYGVTADEALSLLEQTARLNSLRILGFMTVAPMTDNQDIIRGTFRKLKEVYDKAAKEFRGSHNVQMKYLSMGMSSDYTIALKEGSNMLRIGSAIFDGSMKFLNPSS